MPSDSSKMNNRHTKKGRKKLIERALHNELNANLLSLHRKPFNKNSCFNNHFSKKKIKNIRDTCFYFHIIVIQQRQQKYYLNRFHYMMTM